MYINYQLQLVALQYYELSGNCRIIFVIDRVMPYGKELKTKKFHKIQPKLHFLVGYNQSSKLKNLVFCVTQIFFNSINSVFASYVDWSTLMDMFGFNFQNSSFTINCTSACLLI